MKKILLGCSAILVFACQPNQETPEEVKGPKLGFDLADLDTTVSPCEDFFQYTSGNWIKNNPIPETEARWGSFNELIENNNLQVRNLLDSVSKIDSLPVGTYQQMVADFYRSGMDSTKVGEIGLSGMGLLLERADQIETVDMFLRMMIEFKRFGIRHPWSTFVSVDDKNSNAYILQLSQSGLGLPDKDYYLKTDSISKDIQAKYVEHVGKMLELSGYQAEEAVTAAEAIYAFEKKLAEVSMSRVDRRSPEKTYNKRSFQQIVDLAPSLRLKEYMGINKIEFDSAIVGQPEYMKALNDIVQKEEATALRHYAHWNIIDEYAAYLAPEFVNQNFEFYGKTLSGSKRIKPRWKRVLSTINGGLGEALGHLYVDRYFPESSKEKIENMVEDLRSAYKKRIMQLDWMGEETKEKALEKLAGFTYKIGYPNTWDDFEGLEISGDDYLSNVMKLNLYLVKDNLKKLKEEVDKDEWFMPAHIVNAYYNPSYNEVVFPAGILQPPFYNAEAEDALNYGGIGGVIGHEFTHGFDDEGSKYNVEGNLNDWWTADDRTRFDEKTQRLAAQYSAYEPILGTMVNGKLTLGENIADLGGLTLGYYAYKESLANGTEEVEIDGFSWQQRIFLGWAQVWQTNQTDEYLRNQVTTDPHSPAKYRVNGPMSNMTEFREAWGCGEGDAMVNTDTAQVVIW
jgi:putative endopeptidase